MKKSILIIMLMVAVFTPLKNVKANTTIMYVEPQISTVEIFTTFKINISVSQVVDLAAWEFKLYYLNEYLNTTQIQEGPFLKTAGQTSFFVKHFTDNYNSTHGMIWAFCTLLGQGSGVSGNGTLAIISFKAKLDGITTIHLAETDMLDSKMPPNHIAHTTADGTVKILGHDIAITHVTPLKTIIGQSYTMHINITVENQGGYTETFNMTLYANTTAINQTEITLTNSTSTTITLTWNTTGIAKGNYTIWAYAWPVPGETDTADNTFTDGWILVTLPGDINGDHFVNAKDAVALGKAFSSQQGQPNYNPNADLNNDDFINAKDAVILGKYFGQSWQ